MNKTDFIRETALRLITSRPGLKMAEVAEMARQLADDIYRSPENVLMKDNRPISVLIEEMNRIEMNRKEERQKGRKRGLVQRDGHAVRFYNRCIGADITTIGELIAYGRKNFLNLRNMGPRCVEMADEALRNLFGGDIKW